MNTSEIIKALRDERGLSQEDLAEAIGVDRTTIVKYETGKSRPTRKRRELADYFGISLDQLEGRVPIARIALVEGCDKTPQTQQNALVDVKVGYHTPELPFGIRTDCVPASPSILMRAEQDLPPNKRKLLEEMAKALLGDDEKI